MKKISMFLMLVAMLPCLAYASTLTVLDSLFSKSLKNFDNVLIKNSLDSVSGAEIKNSLEASLEILATNRKQFEELLVKSSKEDKAIMRLKSLVNKNVDELQADEIGELVNSMAYFAKGQGMSKEKYFTCSSCGGDALTAIGIKELVRTPGEGTTAASLMKMIPVDDSSLTRSLKLKFKANGLGNFTKQSIGKIDKNNKRSLALFIGYLENGTSEEKKLADAIIAFSKDENGNPMLLQHNKLWSIFDFLPEKKMGKEKRDQFMTKFSDMLEQIATEKPTEGNRNANFRNFLEKRVKENPSLREFFDEFYAKSCWGM